MYVDFAPIRRLGVHILVLFFLFAHNKFSMGANTSLPTQEDYKLLNKLKNDDDNSAFYSLARLSFEKDADAIEALREYKNPIDKSKPPAILNQEVKDLLNTHEFKSDKIQQLTNIARELLQKKFAERLLATDNSLLTNCFKVLPVCYEQRCIINL